jgi:hypothetical protein
LGPAGYSNVDYYYLPDVEAITILELTIYFRTVNGTEIDIYQDLKKL